MEPSEEVVKESNSLFIEFGILILGIIAFIGLGELNLVKDELLGMGLAAASVFIFGTVLLMIRYRKKIKDALGVDSKSDRLNNTLQIFLLVILMVGVIIFWVLLLFSMDFLETKDRIIFMSVPLGLLISIVLVFSIKENNIHAIYYGNLIIYYPRIVFKKLNLPELIYYLRIFLVAIIYYFISFLISWI